MTRVVRLERGLERAAASPRLCAAAAAGVALLVLGGLLFRLDAEPIARTSEARTFDVARGMLDGGGWLVPRMEGEPRLQKPPLYYWTAAVSLALDPSPRRALRLPSALAAVGLLATVFLWGRRVGGFANGALAALCLLSMFKFWELARRGDAEMMLACLTAQALFAFDCIYREQRRDLLPWFFGAALLAFLAKATAAVLAIGLPIALCLGIDRSLGRVVRRDILAWTLACGVACLAWYAAILLWVPGAFAVLRESLLLPLGLVAAADAAAHVRPVWYYVPKLPAAAGPAVLLVPLVAWHVAARGGAPRLRRATFPALAFASLFVAFSLLPMKQRHYLMPLLPLLALAIAPALIAAHECQRRAFERVVAYLGWCLLAVGPALAVLLGLHLAIADEGMLVAGLVGAGVLAASGLGFAAAWRGCARVFGLSAVALTLALVGVHRTSFDPLRESFRQGVAPGFIDFDEARWARTFERHPGLRKLYLAENWRPAAPDATEARAH
jgi:4-amino-4-deoxy-L-arabinose transferase-like glycosyltransferase